MKTTFFILFQKLAPQHAFTYIAGAIASTQIKWFKNLIIEKFIHAYDVNMNEAQNPDPKSYTCFNDFFTRALKAEARPLNSEPNSILSPADGAISQIGDINQNSIFQAKGHEYSVDTLLGGDKALAEQFHGGRFATIYLSPKDYHRVHMPVTGKLRLMNYIPGDLFSVNKTTSEEVPNLFARNERVVTIFDTEKGPAAIVLVGAMIVGSIETVWDGQIAPPSKSVTTFRYNQTRDITLHKGEEMGRFKLGSTAIILFPKDVISWNESASSDAPVRMGEKLGEYIN